MIKKINKNDVRKARHDRTRFYLEGTNEAPRLNVFRSTNNIYAQIINDNEIVVKKAVNAEGVEVDTKVKTSVTLVNASTLDKDIAALVADMDKTAASKEVGKAIAKKALAAGIEKVVFDRGGYLYTGRVAALADGAREGGLKF